MGASKSRRGGGGKGEVLIALSGAQEGRKAIEDSFQAAANGGGGRKRRKEGRLLARRTEKPRGRKDAAARKLSS